MGGGAGPAAWAEYRELRALYYRAAVHCGLFAFVGFVTAAIGIRLRLAGWEWALPGGLVGVPVLAAFTRYSWLSLRVWTWPCPVCGGVFAWSMWTAWPGNRCRRCGARVVEAEPAAAPPPAGG